MKLFLSVSFTILTLFNSLACINSPSKLHLHQEQPNNFIVPGKNETKPKSFYTSWRHTYDSLWKKTNDIYYLIDSGVMNIYLGDYERAKQVFIRAEKIKPGLYETAVNLGTVYELLGQNQHALTWIKKAIDISPDSHFGSEWIHVNILNAKIKGKKFINAEYLIGKTSGADSLPVYTLKKEELNSLRKAIFFQLSERVNFIKTQDKITAQLLFELGNLTALTKDPQSALEIYNLAERYGFNDPLLQKRYSKIKSQIKKIFRSSTAAGGFYSMADEYNTKKKITKWILAGFAVLGLITIGLIFGRRNSAD